MNTVTHGILYAMCMIELVHINESSPLKDFATLRAIPPSTRCSTTSSTPQAEWSTCVRHSPPPLALALALPLAPEAPAVRLRELRGESGSSERVRLGLMMMSGGSTTPTLRFLELLDLVESAISTLHARMQDWTGRRAHNQPRPGMRKWVWPSKVHS